MSEQTVPTVRSAISSASWSVGAFIDDLEDPGVAPLRPFEDVAVSFCARLSKELFQLPNVSRHPEIIALAYWLRPLPIEAARDSLLALQSSSMIFAPRGRVFHIPPANVDTIFVYSWVLSLLMGNINVVRLSDRISQVVDLLLGAIATVVSETGFEAIERRNRFVRTGHEDVASAALSSVADLRVVWGGDATVAHFRRFPLPVRGRELAFPDRHSLAILSAESVAQGTLDELSSLSERFFNDAYWFDQGGCSSPRLVIWYDPTERFAAVARGRFHGAVSHEAESRGYRTEPGIAIEKMVYGYQSIVDQRVVDYEVPTNEATWIELADLASYRRENCGGGMFYEYVSKDLGADLTLLLNRRDQTASYYGIDPAEIRDLARRINGRGIDRWVPLGQALAFDRFWDGFDLLQEFGKRVAIQLPKGP